MMGSAPGMLLVAVPAALAGAAAFGLASALQQRATKTVPPTRALDPRLLRELIRHPQWALGTATVLAGLALQLLALAFAPLALVQPLLVTGLLFGTGFSAWLARRRLDRQILFGAAACVIGLAALLALARPTDTSDASTELADLPRLAPLSGLLAAIVASCLIVAFVAQVSGPVRAGVLALATGVLYGVTAALMKVLIGQLRTGGFPAMLTHPAFYVICVIGPMGFLLSQNTFQHGVLLAPALAVITIVDPMVGFTIGVSWLGERVATTPSVLAGEVLAALALTGGIAVLARRSTQIRRRDKLIGASDREYRTGATWG